MERKTQMIKPILTIFLLISLITNLNAQEYYKSLIATKAQKDSKKNVSLLTSTNEDELSSAFVLNNVTTSSIQGLPFSKIIVAKVPVALEKYWESRIRWFNPDTIKPNTELELVFYARHTRIDDSESLLSIPFKDITNKGDGEVLAYFNLPLSQEWKQYRYKFNRIKTPIAPKYLEMSFLFGRKSQDIEIGGIALISSTDK